MKRIPNIFYTLWAKIVVVLLILFFMLQTSIYFADTTVMYRENDTAVKNVFSQWENYDFETSEYLKEEISTAIDCVLQFSLYYRRDTLSDSQTIVNADDNYREITSKLDSYENLTYALVNHSTNRVISNIPDISYMESSVNVREHFPTSTDNLLIVRDAHNPYYENGTMTEYNDYISTLAQSYDDSFDLYMHFGEDFSFVDAETFRQTHTATLERVENSTTMSLVYLAVAAVLFVFLLTVAGRNESHGKIYPGISDGMANDAKLALYLIVILSMAALYENSLYMALKADNMNLIITSSSQFYIIRSYVAMLINSSIIMALCCTIKRQYKLGTLLTNTYIYQYFFAYKHRTDK